MVQKLAPGQTGCLQAGIYRGELKVSTPHVTIRNFPGKRATIAGRLWIARGANDVTVEELFIDGRNPGNLPSPTVNSRGATFNRVDVTNHHRAICFNLGNLAFGRAIDTTIESSKIHGCGALPAGNHDHGIYLSYATDTLIRGNWIYDNADRGIQLYPDAQRTVIQHNVIYGNGEGIIFSGGFGVASNGNRVMNNVIAGSRVRRNVESFYSPGEPLGSGNVVARNCAFGAATPDYAGPDGSGIETPPVGFVAIDNISTEPSFVNAAGGDYRLVPGSRCSDVMGSRASIGPGPRHALAAPG
jgi:parallel beta-helix repeat protein